MGQIDAISKIPDCRPSFWIAAVKLQYERNNMHNLRVQSPKYFCRYKF